MKPFAILGAAAVLALVTVWFAGNFASDKGSDRMILRLGLGLIALIGVAVIAWFLLQKKKPAIPGLAAKPVAGDQLDLIMREAETRLASAQLGPGTKISNLPVYFVVGPAGAAKTTVVVQSGLEPELLAGEVYTDGVISPTPYSNFWYGKQSVFVEAGEDLLNDPAAWLRLVKHLAPGKLKSVMNQGGLAPRAAIVCVDAETLLRQPLETNLAAARSLRARLSEFASSLGISIPVYALFTKADRIPFFPEFVANLNSAEAAEMFGTTLPLGSTAGGTYSEQETARLNEAYQQLFYSLASRRPTFLGREAMLEKTPAIYEFPREFRKMRAAVVPFLVELCRVSQLTIGPFLRGFYFCGVRPVVVQEVAAAPAPRAATRKTFNAESEATQMFRAQDFQGGQARAEMVGSHAGTRKVPQWVFLSSFFKDVLLADLVALGTSGSSAKTNLARRWLFGAAAAACLLMCVALIVSYANNHNLESTALAAAAGIRSSEGGGSALPSLDALTRLETLRQSVERLAGYDRNGPPLRLRWGLYAGDGLYPHVRRIYFDKFQQLLLLPVQKTWIANLQGLPPAPSPNDDYQRSYDTLKGYLITTSHHEKSTKQFLAPLLGTRWAETRGPGSERTRLAQKQFDFYSEELKLENPFSNETDAAAVKRGRAYLSQFAGTDRVYQFMLSEANKTERPVNFNQDVKFSAEEVLNNKDVPGAFTKGGWAKMQNAIQNADRYFNGEQWVLGGGQSGADIDRANLDQELRKRYYRDFINQWREFLNRSVVVSYKNPKDAATKLNATSGSQSPLLALFNVATQNTAVDAPEIKKAFQALYAVMPPTSVDQYVGPTNSDYMKELAGLQVSMEEVADQPGQPNDASVAKTLAAATSAKLKTRQMAQTFGLDSEGHLDRKVQQLLEDPITHVEEMFRGLGPAELNGKGQAFCGEMRLLTGKYPFSPKATVQASIADVNAVFQPKEGALWKFYDASLQKLLIPQGSQYGPAPAATVHLTPAFVGFFNRSAAFSRALYPEGATAPHLTFKLKPVKMEGIDGVAVEIDGQTLAYNGSGEAKAATFAWPGGTHDVKATTTPPYPWFTEPGLWAVYDFLSGADRAQTAGSVSRLEYDVVARVGNNPRNQAGNTPRFVTFDLDMGANPPIFQKGYLSGFGCVSEVAK